MMHQQELFAKLNIAPWYNDISQDAARIEYDCACNHINLFFNTEDQAFNAMDKARIRNITAYGKYETWRENETPLYRVTIPLDGRQKRYPKPLLRWPDQPMILD